MPDQQQIQNNTSDELDEVLVKEPDGTFRVMKITPAQATPKVTSQQLGGQAPLNQSQSSGTGQAPITKQGVVTGQAPRIAQPAPVMRSLADEEEKEVAGLAEKAKALGTAQGDAVEVRVRQAMKESGVILTDQTLASRLATVLTAYCKEVRNELETRALLMKPKEVGGLALTMSEAARLIASLGAGEKSPTQKIPALPPKPITSPLPVVQKPLAPPQVIVQPTVKVQPVAIPKLSPQPLPVKPVMPAPALRPVTPPLQAKRPLPEAKPIVQDVTFTPTLVGPLDELRMSLIAWRRMAPTVKDRATKIEEKLCLLEEEAYPERLKGIAAWYGSEVVQRYEDVGRESLMTGKSVAEILTERQASGNFELSLEEFQSIAELNEKLRF